MDVTEIAKLYTTHGPYVSLYLNAPVAVENAAQRLDLAWRSTRKELLDAGADEATVDALEPAVLDDRTEGNSLVAFASHGSLLYSRRLPEELGREAAITGALPYVTPLLSWRRPASRTSSSSPTARARRFSPTSTTASRSSARRSRARTT